MKDVHKRRAWEGIVVALVVGLAFQIPLGYFLVEQTRGGLSIDIPQKRPVRARFRPYTKKKEPEKKEEEIPKGTIVDVPEPKKPKKPKDTKHLAKFDVDVPKEKKARVKRRRKKKPRAGKAVVQRPSRLQSKDSDSPKPTKLPKVTEEQQLPKVRTDMRPAPKGRRTVADEHVRGQKPSLLLPHADEESAFQNLQTLTAEMHTDDPLLDIDEEGDTTAIKARSFRFHDFFNRVKERVRQEWRPRQVYKARDPRGNIYGRKDRLTILRVTLDKAGKVRKVSTHKACGVEFLDKEARRAFKAAAPFPNPPKGLLDEYGNITFGVGFLFEIGSSRPKFFWKRM